jgi:hypothetical protein
VSKSLERIPRATPAQLRRAADVDLWRGGTSGADVRFDAERFGEWLETLTDAGNDIVTRQLAALDLDLVAVGIAEHVRVFDGAARTPGADDVEVGGYLVVARSGRPCQPILDTLAVLHEEDPHYFHRVMRACVGLSNDGYERDGLDDLLVDRDQAMFDLVAAREERRERQGFVTAAQARAFLAATAEGRAALFRAHLRDTSNAEVAPPVESGDDRADPGDDADDDEVADAAAPRALLGGAPGEPARTSRLQALLHHVHDRDAFAFAARVRELGYLANVIVAACVVQGRALTPSEAADAAAATCDLAIECHRAKVADDWLVDRDLLDLFGDGWALLRQRVCLPAARRLADALGRIEYHDPDTQKALVALRRDLKRHLRDRMPWRAAASLDVLAVLDTPTWAGMVGLIAECPVLHAAIPAIVDRRRAAIDPAAFAFFRDARQLAMVDAFLDRLPALLTG